MKKEKAFDFDYWMNLAKKNPEVFEAQRAKLIESYIAEVPGEVQRDRLSRLQWRVNKERELASSPMDAAVRIYDMMWESVGKNVEALQDLADVLAGDILHQPVTKAKKDAAQILPFRSGTQG